jgi:hypothetical protein
MTEPARRGTVFYCAMRTEPPADVGEGPLVVVLDDAGTAAYVTGGTDMSGWILSPFNTEPGRLCREFVAGLTGLPSGFALDGREVYAFALAYWFLEGEPARMDADSDGIPCEQVFPPEVVRDVWSGDVRI